MGCKSSVVKSVSGVLDGVAAVYWGVQTCYCWCNGGVVLGHSCKTLKRCKIFFQCSLTATVQNEGLKPEGGSFSVSS